MRGRLHVRHFEPSSPRSRRLAGGTARCTVAARRNRGRRSAARHDRRSRDAAAGRRRDRSRSAASSSPPTTTARSRRRCRPAATSVAVSADFVAAARADRRGAPRARPRSIAKSTANDRRRDRSRSTTSRRPRSARRTSTRSSRARCPAAAMPRRSCSRCPRSRARAPGSTEIVVWGAAPQDTRMFVDGVPVPALYHLGGYRSAVGNDLIGDIQLDAGGVRRRSRPRDRRRDRHRHRRSRQRARVARRRPTCSTRSVEGRTTLGGVTIAAARPPELARSRDRPRRGSRRSSRRTRRCRAWTDAQLVARATLADRTRAHRVGDRLARHARSRARLRRSRDADRRARRSALVRAAGHAAPRPRRRLRQRDAVGRPRSRPRRSSGSACIPADRTNQRRGSAARAACSRSPVRPRDADARRRSRRRVRRAHARRLAVDPGARRRPPHLRPAARRRRRRRSLARDDDRRRRPRDASTSAPAASSRRSACALDGWLLDREPAHAARRRDARHRRAAELDFDAGSARLRAVRASTDDVALRVDGGRYHQARAASDTSAVFGTPTLGVEQAVARDRRRPVAPRAPFAIEVAGYAALARRSRRARSRGHAAARAGAHAGRHRPRPRRAGHRARRRLARPVGLAQLQPVAQPPQGRRPTMPERFFDHDQTHGLIAVAGWEHGPWTLGGARALRDRRAAHRRRSARSSTAAPGRFEPIRRRAQRRAPARVLRRRRPRRAPVPARAARRGAVYVEIQNLTDRANAEEIIYSADFTQTRLPDRRCRCSRSRA